MNLSGVDRVVLPGDILGIFEAGDTLKLGPGIRVHQESIVATKAGVLRQRKPASIFWIDSNQKRYVPVAKEHVIGIVTAKLGDNFRVDIGSSQPATLSYLAFEGATKRNRPNVKIGDVVYSQISVANKDMEPELVCTGNGGKAQLMGALSNDGFMFKCSLGLCRKLLLDDSPVLKYLGKHVSYEIAIGLNGRVWIKSHSIGNTILAVNAIVASEHMNAEEIKTMVTACSRNEKNPLKS
eukprot:m.1170 g.1170  ORF g.1170 m.1170 type:complete len:238 (+) comp5800_c0_seq1:2-715(+)